MITMKNLFFALSFLFATSLGFANTNNSVEINNEDGIEITSNVLKIDISKINDVQMFLNNLELEVDSYGCVELYYNYEFIGYACGDSLGDILDNILDMFF